MTTTDQNPFDALEKVFHEPNRLSIMSALCAADKGLTFKEIRNQCDLTDGNLNRHLKVLDEAEVICISKAFVDNKPRTTVTLSKKGLKRFQEYLSALQQVLSVAKEGLQEEASAQTVPTGKTVLA